MIHITDGQTEEILNTVTESYVEYNRHRQSMKDYLETFDFKAHLLKDFGEHIGKNNRLVIPLEDGDFQEFIIHEVYKKHDRNGLYVEVYSVASYQQLKKSKIIGPQKLESQTTTAATSFAVAGTEWELGRIAEGGLRTIEIDTYTNPLRLLKMIATAFDCELRFRIETDGNKITGRFVDLLRSGKWQGREIEFGESLIDIERREYTANIVTKLVGLGPVQEDGNRLTVEVSDDQALARWGRNGQHLVDYYEPTTSDIDMSLERLESLTSMELKKRINEVVEYRGNVVDLERVSGMENKRIRYADHVKIKDLKFNPPLYLEARVHTQERDIFNRAMKEVELGDFTELEEEDVKAIWSSLQAAIKQRVSEYDLAEYTYEKAVIDNKDNDVYQGSTSYAEGKASEAESNAKIHAEDKAEAAQSAAEAYAEAKAELEAAQARADAESYTDSKISEEVQARVEQAQQKLSEAMEYADSLAVSTLQDAKDHSDNAMNAIAENLENAETNISNAFSQIDDVKTDIENKADIEYVNGQLQTKADIDSVNQEFEDVRSDLADKAGLEYVDGSISSIQGGISEIESGLESAKSDIANKADAVWVDGQLQTKADADSTYSKTEIDTSLNAKVDQTTYTTDRDGFISRLDSAESSITQNEEEIELRVEQTTYDIDINDPESGVKSRLSSAESSITQNANEISSKVSQTDFDSLDEDVGGIGTRLSSAESSISQQAGLIESKVSQTDFDDLSGSVGSIDSRVSSAESSISQQADLIESKVSQTDYDEDIDGVVYRLSNAESTITQQADQIESRVTKTDYNSDQSELNDRISSAETAISQNSEEITLRATKTELESLEGDIESIDGRVSENESSLSVQADEIASKVSQTDYDSDLDGVISRLDSTESSITQNADNINLRVEKTEYDEFKNDVDSNISGINSTLSNQQTEINQNANNITLKASQTEVDNLSNDVSSAWSQINVNSSEIESKVSQTDFDSVEGRLESAESSITQQANLIESKVSQTDFDAVEDRITSAESSISQQADQIEQRVTKSDYEDDQDNFDSRISYAESLITQNANEISSKVNQSDFNNAEDRLSTAESNISQQADLIESKVSQTDFNAVENRVSTAESSISQQADLIESKVSQTEFDSLQIGGRNLLEESDNELSTTGHTGYSITDSFNIKPGEKFTISMDLRIEGGGSFDHYFRDNGGAIGGVYPSESADDEFQRFKITETAPDGVEETITYRFRQRSGGTLHVKNAKLERGNKATDWTPAPEDVDDKFNDYSTTSQVESKISQSADSITQSVSQTYATKNDLSGEISTVGSRISSVEQNLEGITTTVSSVSSDLSSLSQDVSSVEQTVSGITSTVSSLESDLGNVEGRVSSAESSISQNASAINLRATKSEVDAIEGRVSSAESTLSLQAEQISARVRTSEFESLFEQTAQSFTFSAEQIDFVGTANFTIGDGSNGKTSINGGRLSVSSMQFYDPVDGYITVRPLLTGSQPTVALRINQGFDAEYDAYLALENGDYPLRARGTTKSDVGLGNVDNYSRSHYDSRYARTSHTHDFSDVISNGETASGSFQLSRNHGNPTIEGINNFSTTIGLAGVLGRSTANGMGALGTRQSSEARAGVYGEAGTAGDSFAGYFDGDVKINGDLEMNGAVSGQPLTNPFSQNLEFYKDNSTGRIVVRENGSVIGALRWN